MNPAYAELAADPEVLSSVCVRPCAQAAVCQVFRAADPGPPSRRTIAGLAADIIASLCGTRRGAVVQAGGCAGLWPLALARRFGHVYTFEPAPGNFACLRQNTAGVGNISAYDYALSDARRLVGLTRPKPGATRLLRRPGWITPRRWTPTGR